MPLFLNSKGIYYWHLLRGIHIISEQYDVDSTFQLSCSPQAQPSSEE